MGLLSFLKRRSGDSPSATPAPDVVDSVQQARIRARQRLIGAVVLVAAGVIGFPMLFETQPRPLSVNTPIEIARRDSGGPASSASHGGNPAPAVAAPTAPAVAAGGNNVINETSDDAGHEVPSPASAPETAVPAKPPSAATAHPAKPTVAAAPPKPAASKPQAAPEKKPVPPKPADNPRAEALLNGRDAPAGKPETAAEGSRFVVQVGAFGDTAAAREARQKVEKLGLKTYTQVVDTSAGKRIRVRVGPFASRAEADKASSKLKASGMSPAVFTL